MSKQRTNTTWAITALALIAGMGMLAQDEAHEQQHSVLVYCEGVAVFEAEKARGVPLDKRIGHRDWNDRINVPEQCPGMRPAAPALPQSAYQLVQF